jgi:hypothetical protein
MREWVVQEGVILSAAKDPYAVAASADDPMAFRPPARRQNCRRSFA